MANIKRSLSAEEALKTMIGNSDAHVGTRHVGAPGVKEHSRIEVHLIDPNPNQPRLVFDEEKINKLAQSISESGLHQPIGVRQKGNRYEIIFGECRLRAHKKLGLNSIEVLIMSMSDEDSAYSAIAENFIRDDLSDYETGRALHLAAQKFVSRRELEEVMGVTRQDLFRYLEFMKLPSFITARLDKNPHLISRGVAEQLRKTLDKYADHPDVNSAMETMMNRLEDGSLKKGALPLFLESILTAPKPKAEDAPVETKITRGKKAIGSFKKDKKHMVLKLRAQSISPEQEAKLMALLEEFAQ